MKQVKFIELIKLNGGATGSDCMKFLQQEANTHKDSGNQALENAFWDNWADRFDECVRIQD